MMSKELKFSQLVYIVERYCTNPTNERRVGYKFEYDYKVLECRVINSDEGSAYLDRKGFIPMGMIYTDEEEAKERVREIREIEYEKNYGENSEFGKKDIENY